jgi:triacylglycerol esterase/lipase EstA (alpha/beta hydrolase family)
MKIAAALAFGILLLALPPVGAEAAPEASVAAASASTTLYTLDPFLVGPGNLGDIDLSTFLTGNPDLADYTALNLVADGASAAIVLFQTNSNAPVKFTVNSAASLLPYSAAFLKQAPATGTPSLTVSGSGIFQIGATYYAAALVQGPLKGYSAANSIVLHATQNGVADTQKLGLVIPPVVLVHGLWGDKSSLANVEAYLDSASPWESQTKLVQPVCYSLYLAFDAKKDPLTDGTNPCEVTSQDAVQNEIDALLAELDSEHSVGGRVDLVVHSMGGLVARNYASQSSYASLRNRMQGQFHTIVTLNTPEIGSLLAPYLISVRNNTRQAPIETPQGFIWYEVCGNATVAVCFNANGYPIYSPKLALDSGAVYSLTPGGPALSSPKLSGPAIANSTWRAVSSLAPGNSALEFGLDTLFSALYPNPFASTVPTINSVLLNLPNDAIVILDSQTSGAQANQYYTFSKLSHTSLVGSILTYLSGDTLNDNSVVDDPSAQVYQLAGCWLKTTGADTCLPAAATTNAPATQAASSPFKPVDRIEVTAPATVVLGKPFEVAVHMLVPGLLPHLSVYEQGEQGSTRLEPVAGTRTAGNIVYALVTPRLLGPVRFGIRAAFDDGGVSGHAVRIFVVPPKAAPLAFQANELPTLVLNLNSRNTTIMPHPQALYVSPVGTVYLNSRYVTYRLIPEAGQAVIRVESDGIIHALAPGVASVEARFGSVSDRLRVIVRASQQ